MERFIGPLPEFHREIYRLSEAIKIEIVRLHRNEFGTPYRIAKLLNKSRWSVNHWRNRYEEERELQCKVNANGRLSFTTENEDFLLTCSAVVNNFDNSLAIAGNAGLAHLSQNSISRRLTKSGMHSRVVAIKDFLTEEHHAARLHFARRYVHYPIEFWRWVIFTDEKSWSSSAHGQLRVRRQKKTKIQSRKHLFHKKKRQNNSECLGRHVLVALDWPTKGADMNPIENIWGYLVCKLTKARTDKGMPYHARDANNANLLFELVRTEWGKLINNEVYLKSLIESMAQRLQKVIDAEGGRRKILIEKREKNFYV
ncbi:hypothetical protein GHT06_014482 [Daphnia sinensis]|uniref:Transposase Tc1-like domain-containing protein n=1 Tax=Daphnia sinensis TaxID=1820382 RepID=A0AAD5PV82_9CRUS|nr:hypothetical protein GHT06_014482 [Daphnia sinensis]